MLAFFQYLSAHEPTSELATRLADAYLAQARPVVPSRRRT